LITEETDHLAARDSIYEAEGEGSDVKRSQELFRDSLLDKAHLNSAASNEALIDPSAIAKATDATLMADVIAVAKSDNI
jgi:hypothetical protein